MLTQKGYFYVCGDAANMAREVNAVLAQIIAEGRGVTEAKGEEIVKNMRAANQYQVRNAEGVLKAPAFGIFPFLSTHADPGYRRTCGLERGASCTNFILPVLGYGMAMG